MKLYTKDELIDKIRQISTGGWYRSVKKIRDTRNDGAVGNTIEALLGLQENNLPIPNLQEWELKGQRLHTKSLVTLKHIEPSPRSARIVANLLVPMYGWKHKEAGKKYPSTEQSFRSTIDTINYTNRGFRLHLDRRQGKLSLTFDAKYAQIQNPDIAEWLNAVEQRIGLGPISPEPYWGLADLEHEIGAKLKNCFYVIAESKLESEQEFFKYVRLQILSGFSFDRFLKLLEEGVIFVDFDARTGHNHGTKFRIKQNHLWQLYSNVQDIIL